MICDLCVSLISPPNSTLCPASPSLGWVAWVSLPHLLDRLRGHRYYVQLRLPLPLLGSLRFWLASQYLCRPPFVLCSLRLAGGNGSTRSRLALCFSGWPSWSGCSPTRSWRFSQVPRLPLYAHAPLAVSGGVGMFAITHPDSRLPVAQNCRLSPLPSRVIHAFPMDHNYTQSEIGNAAYAFTTPGFIHTLLDMHAGSLQAGGLFPPGGTWPVSRPHPLGNINQFYGVLSDPKVLGLT